MLFVGDDWAEDHHDVELVDEAGTVLARKRLPEGLAGVTGLHALIGEHLPDPGDDPDPHPQVMIGIEASGTRKDPPGPLRPQQTPRERSPTMGVLLDARLSRRHGALPATVDPVDRHPPRLPQDRHHLRRAHRLGPQPRARRLTATEPGMSAAFRAYGLAR